MSVFASVPYKMHLCEPEERLDRHVKWHTIHFQILYILVCRIRIIQIPSCKIQYLCDFHGNLLMLRKCDSTNVTLRFPFWSLSSNTYQIQKYFNKRLRPFSIATAGPSGRAV